MKPSLRAFVGLVLLALVLMLGRARMQPVMPSPAPAAQQAPASPEAAVGSGFTYQGQLKHNGAPVNAVCNFTFSLWDAAGAGSPPVGGNAIGNSQAVNAVAVANGLFSVLLNAGGEFGANAFNGAARWLQTSVTCPGDSGASTLSPRQPVTPAPYALLAPGSPLARVVTVAASGGDFTSIQAALDSITDAGPANPYLVWIAPGVYNERVTMKEYVDIEGAGQNLTTISFAGSLVDTAATLTTASNAELRSLTVENTGGATYAIAILNSGTFATLTGITARASGDGNISAAVFNVSTATSTIRNSRLLAVDAGFNHYAVYSRSTSYVEIHDSSVSAYGGSTSNYGVISTVSSTAYIFDSIVWGTGAAMHMLNSTGRIAASELVGGATTAGTGILGCVGAYDQSFVALNVLCQ